MVLKNFQEKPAKKHAHVVDEGIFKDYSLRTRYMDQSKKGPPKVAIIMSVSVLKHSYTVPCSSVFRDDVEALAKRRRVNVGDLARSIFLMVSLDAVEKWPDPGEPPAGDRETVLLKSGPAAGRPWRRKPRLQVRMPPGHEIQTIRQALALALALDKGEYSLVLNKFGEIKKEEPTPQPKIDFVEMDEEIERLRAAISVLAFDPLPDGVRSREDALYVLGFPPSVSPDSKMIRAKFRMLATIHHPDSMMGSHQRMSQLNQAIDILKHFRY